MAIEIMKSPMINMHGPEHHFLVPAVLITSYYNIKDEKKNKIKTCSCQNEGEGCERWYMWIFMEIVVQQ